MPAYLTMCGTNNTKFSREHPSAAPNAPMPGTCELKGKLKAQVAASVFTERAFPGECMSDDEIQICELGHPAEPFPDLR